MTRSLVCYTVRPGEDCKVVLPPCSALEIKHAALTAGSPPAGRCTLLCDLATHGFVLCSMPPRGVRMQASLSTVVTNDPDQSAWIYLKATGERAFHVIGRLVVDRKSAAAKAPSAAGVTAGAGTVVSQRRLHQRQEAAAVAGEDDDEAWPTAADIAPSAPASRGAPASQAKAGTPIDDGDDDDQGEEADDNIEVLLPEDDDSVEFELSEADSDDFVQWMQSRTSGADKLRASDSSGRLAQSAGPGRSGSARQVGTGKRPRPDDTERRRAPGKGGSAGGAVPSQVLGHETERSGGAASGGSRTQRRRAAQKRATREAEHAGGADE